MKLVFIDGWLKGKEMECDPAKGFPKRFKCAAGNLKLNYHDTGFASADGKRIYSIQKLNLTPVKGKT